MVVEGGELGRIPSQPLHLVRREQAPAVRGVRLDLPGGLQRLLEGGADLDAGADLLAEDLVAVDAVLGERVQLRIEFLPERRATGVSSADVRARQVRIDRGGHRSPGPPLLAWSTVGRRLHPQLLRELAHLSEAAGVVRAGDRSAARAARRAGSRLALRARMAFDEIGFRPGGRGRLLRVRHDPGFFAQRKSQNPTPATFE